MNELVITEEFLAQVENLQILLKNNTAGQFGGNHKSKTFGSSCEYVDFREYIQGDDTGKIDWNAFARTEKLLLKLYADERQMHTRIYIDASRSMAFGSGKKDVQALRLAATFAYLSVCDTDKVSIYAVREEGVDEVIASIIGKEAYFSEILKLNDVEFRGDCAISSALFPEKLGYGDGLSVIISDFLTDNDYEDAIDRLAGKKRDLLCIQVLSNEELKPSLRGKMHLYDSENTEKFYRKNINRDRVAAYRQALDDIENRIKDFCELRGANYILAPAEVNILELFFNDFTEMGVIK